MMEYGGCAELLLQLHINIFVSTIIMYQWSITGYRHVYMRHKMCYRHDDSTAHRIAVDGGHNLLNKVHRNVSEEWKMIRQAHNMNLCDCEDCG